MAVPRPSGAAPSPSREPPLRRLVQRLRRSSIRRKILSVIFISGTVPALLVLALAHMSLARVIETGVGQFLLERAESVANQIDARLDVEIQTTREMAASEAIRQLVSAPPGALPPQIATNLSGAGFAFLMDAHGRLLVSGAEDPLLQNALLEAPWARWATEPGIVRILEHYVPGGGPGWAILVTPVEVAEAVGAFLVRRVSMASLVDPALPSGVPDYYITVVNAAGLPVAGRTLDPPYQGLFYRLLTENPRVFEAWGVDRSPEGLKQVLAFRQLRGLGVLVSEGRAEGNWFIESGFSLGALLGSLEYQIWLTVIIGLLAVAFFLVVGDVLTRRIIRPLRLLRADVEMITAGRLDQRVDIRTNDEIEDLAQHVNIMAARLEGTLSDLAAKVRELRVRTDQLETLSGVTRAITETLDREQLLTTFQREVRRLVAFDALWVALVQDEEETLEIIHSHWVSGEAPAGLRVGASLSLDGTRMGEAVVTREPQIIADLRAAVEPRGEDSPLREGGCRSALILPLVSPGGPIGVAGLASREPSRFGPAEATLLSQIAQQLGVGLDHARLYTQLRSLAADLEDKVFERTAELQAAQRQLLQSEKFVATGRLAASVAHEINNPLAIIKNYLRLIRDNLEAASGGRRQTDPNLPNVLVIQEEIDRIARIIRNLLQFYRGTLEPGGKPELVEVNEEILSILRLFETGMEKRHITIRLGLAEDLPLLSCSADLIRQVFLNLIRNAEDAMEDQEGGVLTITTAVEDSHLVATVADTGHGIAPENLDRIFDPFFTTKAESGTGLGLAVTYGILASLGGRIDVESEVGKGTKFTLRIPLARANP